MNVTLTIVMQNWCLSFSPVSFSIGVGIFWICVSVCVLLQLFFVDFMWSLVTLYHFRRYGNWTGSYCFLSHLTGLMALFFFLGLQYIVEQTSFPTHNYIIWVVIASAFSMSTTSATSACSTFFQKAGLLILPGNTSTLCCTKEHCDNG